jgi:hypothetical protein
MNCRQGNSHSKGPEVGLFMVHLKKSKEATVGGIVSEGKCWEVRSERQQRQIMESVMVVHTCNSSY